MPFFSHWLQFKQLPQLLAPHSLIIDNSFMAQSRWNNLFYVNVSHKIVHETQPQNLRKIHIWRTRWSEIDQKKVTLLQCVFLNREFSKKLLPNCGISPTLRFLSWRLMHYLTLSMMYNFHHSFKQFSINNIHQNSSPLPKYTIFQGIHWTPPSVSLLNIPDLRRSFFLRAYVLF